MTATTILALPDGTRVVVADTLLQATPYVLQEQGDWFEPEIRFVRRLLQPGERAIDIGANHGLYTLAMARAVGAQGRVWAYEPASGVGALLARSLQENGFPHVQLLREALSDHEGSAAMAVGEQSELNTLNFGAAAPEGTTETVALSTLDHGLVRRGWGDIAFVKMDAEGEEARILDGGRHFFGELAPLVMVELRHGEAIHLELLNRFRALGFGLFRLIPGLNMLAPVGDAAGLDGFVLNVFACKPARAQALAARGLLVPRTDAAAPAPDDDAWWRWCATRAYCRPFQPLWRSRAAAAQPMLAALALYAQSTDEALPPPLRLAALQASHQRLRELAPAGAATLASASLARVALAAGAREQALAQQQRLLAAVQSGRVPPPLEPFLPPAERFESIAPGAAPASWLHAATLEAVHLTIAHSACYRPLDDAIAELQAIGELGFADDGVRRRLDLARGRLQLLRERAAR